MKFVIILLVWIPLILLSQARYESDYRWQWKLCLFALELGHLIAFLAIAGSAIAIWKCRDSLFGKAQASLGVLCAIGLWIPALEAIALSEGEISVPRLFTTKSPPAMSSVVAEALTYREINGERLEALVYRVKGAKGPQPVILQVHSGSWQGGSHAWFADWHRELASHGYVVVSIQYRFTPAYRWPAQQDDIVAAVDWIRSNAETLNVDPERLCFLGRSAGGQIALATAFAQNVPGLKACVAFYTVPDMLFARKWAREDDALNSVKVMRDYLGGDPDEVPDAYQSSSASYLIHDGTPPVLLIHGANDALVWVEQTRRFHVEMTKANRPCEYLEIPSATHACDYLPWTPSAQLMLQRTLEFLRLHL